jgi:hypothetical protein
VIGYDEGTIMIKMGREVPVASMDSSGKIIWAKHNEIQTVNIKAVGADTEVVFVNNVSPLKSVCFHKLIYVLFVHLSDRRRGTFATDCEGARKL